MRLNIQKFPNRDRKGIKYIRYPSSLLLLHLCCRLSEIIGGDTQITDNATIFQYTRGDS